MEQKADVRPAGGNWCYKSNGAMLKNPERNVMIEAYKSYLKHLRWSKKIQEKMKYDTKKINKHIEHYEKLLSKVVA